MKRPFALIGFTSFAVLLILNLIEQTHIAFIVFVISVITGVVSLIMKKYRQAPALPVYLFTVAFACFLFICCDTDRAIAQSLTGNNIEIEATVSESPYFRKDRRRYYCILNLNKVNGQKTKGKLRLSFSCAKDGISPEELEIGNSVKFTAKVYIPGENEKSVSRYFAGEKILLGAYGAKNLSINEPSRRSLSFCFSMIRKFVSDKLQYGFSDKISGLLTALLTGDKSLLDSNLYRSFRISGIAHLLAVSGVHLSIWVFTLVSLIPENKRTSKFKYLLLLIIVAFIMLLAGMSESVKRAGLMSAVFLSGKMLSRKSDSLNSLGFSVFLMLISNPACALSTSLQLSFLSTLSILTLGETLMKNGHEIISSIRVRHFFKKPLTTLADSAFVSISVLVFTCPVLIYSFGGISTVTVLSNMLMLPVITPLLFLSGVYVIFSQISFIAYPVSVVIKLFCSFAISVAENCSEIKNAFLPFEREEVLLYIAAAVIVTWFIAIVLKRDLKRKLIVNLSVLFLCTVLVTAYENRSSERVYFRLYNINENLISAVEYKGETLLYSEASDYENSLAVSAIEENGATVSFLLTDINTPLNLLDAENGKITHRAETVTLFNNVEVTAKDAVAEFSVYGKYIYIFNTQSLQSASTCDIITVNQSDKRDRLVLTVNGKSFYSDKNSGFVIMLDKDGTMTLRGENSWRNLMKKA